MISDKDLEHKLLNKKVGECSVEELADAIKKKSEEALEEEVEECLNEEV